jgi:hypothetical protein
MYTSHIYEQIKKIGANPLIKNKYGEFPSDIATEKDINFDSDYVKYEIFKHIIYKDAYELGLPLELYAAYEDLKYYDIIEEIKKKKNELKKLLNTQLRYDQTSINFENSYDISILSKHKEQIEKLYYQRYIYLYLPKNYISYSIIQKHSYIRKELTSYMLDLLENDNYDLLDKVKIFKIEFMKWSEPKYIEASAPIDNNESNNNNNSSSSSRSYEDRELRVDRGSDDVHTSIIGSTCNNNNNSDVENNNIGVIHPTVVDNHHHHSSSAHNNHHRMGDNHYNHYNNASVCRVYNNNNNNNNDSTFNNISTSTAYDHQYLTHATTTTAIAYIVNDDGHLIDEEAVGLLDHSLIDRKRQLV